MRRLAVVVGCCVAGGACAVPAVADQAPPPPQPPKPVSLTIQKVNRSLVVVVKCKHLTRKNARHNTDNLFLEVHTFRPRGGYGVQSNGPGMPVAVHPYAGPEGSTSGPATLKISIKHQTETFTFGLKAIKNPHRVKIRAGNQAQQLTPYTYFRVRR